MGRGLGYVDMHVLASVALQATASLWTRDGRCWLLPIRLDWDTPLIELGIRQALVHAQAGW